MATVPVNVSAGASVPPVAAESAAPRGNASGGNAQRGNAPSGNTSGGNSSGKPKKVLTLIGSVLAESGAGFGVGTMLAKGNVTGTSLLVAAASMIFAFDVALRYIPAVANAAAQKSVFTWAFMGTVVLSALALIPYTIMKKKGKGKAGAAAAPTMAGAWTLGALLFTFLAARGGEGTHVQGALQGSIISIMYMALASIAGYNAQTKQVGTSTFAGGLWALLAMFDALGLSRTP
jgi:hypothetical protein